MGLKSVLEKKVRQKSRASPQNANKGERYFNSERSPDSRSLNTLGRKIILSKFASISFSFGQKNIAKLQKSTPPYSILSLFNITDATSERCLGLVKIQTECENNSRRKIKDFLQRKRINDRFTTLSCHMNQINSQFVCATVRTINSRSPQNIQCSCSNQQ